MKNAKRTLALLLILTMCLSLLPLSAFAEGEAPEDEVWAGELGDEVWAEEPEAEAAPCEHEPAEAVTENESAPTCTESGRHDVVVYCALCGEELSRETVEDPAPGHTPADAEEIPPEAGMPGHTTGVICAVCGEVLEGCEVIEALPAEITAQGEEIAAQEDPDGIPIDETNFPDPIFRAYVSNEIADGGDVLTDEMIEVRTGIEVDTLGIRSLQGIGFFENLQFLSCSLNNLTELDLSGCGALTTLYCYGCSLTALDLSGCSALETLACSDNALTALDLSGCSALENVNCSYNALTALNLSGCSALKELECFENGLTELDLSDCASLANLDCAGNRLTGLDFSSCTALAAVNCSGNALEGELDLSSCTELWELSCSYNMITELDLTNCDGLFRMDCSYCPLDALDLAAFCELRFFYCEGCGLSELDLSACGELEALDCSGNALTALNLSGCPALEELDCTDNPLTALDLSACDVLTDCIVGGVTDSGVTARGNTWLLFGDEFQNLYVDENVARTAMVPAPFPPEQFTLNFTYRLMKTGDRMPILPGPSDDPALFPVGLDARWVDEVIWQAAGEDGTVPEDPAGLAVSIEDGVVIARHQGTACVVAMIPDREGSVYVSASCRVDVTEPGAAVEDVRLAGNKATVELYREAFTRVTVIPVLAQNLHSAAVDFDLLNADTPVDAEVTIESAEFVEDGSPKSEGINEVFKLRIADDRTLEIVPYEHAVQNPASVKGSYTAKIAVRIRGNTFTTDSLTLTVKKSLPKVAARVGKLNSFLVGSAQAVSFSGEPVEEVRVPDELPDWLLYEESTRSFVYAGEPDAACRAGLNLKVKPAGWRVELNVPVTVSASKSAPKLKVTPGSVSLHPDATDTVYADLTVTPAAYAGSGMLPVGVESVTEKNRDAEGALGVQTESDHVLIWVGPAAPKDGKAHTYKVTLAMMRQNADGEFVPSSAKTTMTVKLAATGTKLTMSGKAVGAVDKGIYDSCAEVRLNVKGLSYFWVSEDDVVVLREKNGQDPLDVTDQFIIEGMGYGVFRFYANHDDSDLENLEPGYTYTAVFRYRLKGSVLECRVKLPVKFTDPANARPSVTLRATGAIDVIRPDSFVTVTSTGKNCYLTWAEPKDLHIQRLVDGEYVDITDEALNPFESEVCWEGYDCVMRIRLKPAEDDGTDYTKEKFRVYLTSDMYALDEDGISQYYQAYPSDNTVALSIRMGSARLTPSGKAVTLLKDDCNSAASVTLQAPDETLAPVDWVRTLENFVPPKDKAGNALFELRPAYGNDFAIGYAGGKITTDKGATVKIPVFLQGNHTGKPNATVSVKVSLG